MNKIKRRSYFALVIASAICIGLGIFLVKLVADGSDWVMLRSNENVFNNGELATGTVTDRNGIILAQSESGVFNYADDQTTRMACLHAVGDFNGNIGSGAISAFDEKLAGYNIINGVNSILDNGGKVKLSIDATLNIVAYNALAGRRGAVLVSNYKTGEILCMVSTPTIDPQNPPDMTNPQYEGAYMNRCLGATYIPGSVFKLITMAAAIESIPDLNEQTFYCEGGVYVGEDYVKCTGWHGQQTIEQALANSCNSAISEISQQLGADKIYEYTNKFGFLESLDVSGINTAAGNFDKAETGTSDLSWSGIGQYNDLISPVAMLRYVSAIANDGVAKGPVLIHGEHAENTRLLSSETATKLADMMNYNVSYAYGTDRFPGLSMCAKTGTAETGDGTSHAWFTGFLKDENNPFAFSVIVENGGGGLSAASPVANAVLQAAVK